MKYARLILGLAAFAAVATSVSHAQETPADSLVASPFPAANASLSLDQKIDRLGEDVTEIKKDVKTIRRELVESPLGNRAWGIEINPLSVLFASEGAGLAGTVSNFSWSRSAEVAFPVYYSMGNSDDRTSVFQVDAQYRRFLGEAQRGFYLSGFTRFQHARYESYDYSVFYEEDSEMRTINRLGIGFGLGGRIFSRPGFYWGWNLSFGRFLLGDKIGEDEMPSGPYLLGDLIIDAELLKIGFAF
ncbi:MAG: hypothetical protein K0Q91_539 [Fibrobacteria bacterium]|jgi:hypothetical protein|nr:hypothetical protein [Fibrobacteria bacterium]